MPRAVQWLAREAWFSLTADYAPSVRLERTLRVVNANGGKVLGVMRHPLNTSVPRHFPAEGAVIWR
jgi:branched-chain amino acid transport system substrate-binding protein